MTVDFAEYHVYNSAEHAVVPDMIKLAITLDITDIVVVNKNAITTVL